MTYRRFWLALTIAAAPLCSHAQWINLPSPATPRTHDGKPNLSAPAPRVKSKPDLSGIWEPEGSPRKELEAYLLPGGENGLGEIDITKYFANFFADYKFGEEPFQPEARARFQKALKSGGRPPTLCPPPSVPINDIVPVPIKLIQSPGLLLKLSEDSNTFRQIHTDGRQLPKDPQPTFQGYSVGHWEGDSLVVETAGFNDLAPLDAMGHPHSEALRVTERFHRPSFGHMDLQITVDDPKTYTKPATIKVGFHLLPDTDLLESFCELEKDLPHIGK